MSLDPLQAGLVQLAQDVVRQERDDPEMIVGSPAVHGLRLYLMK
jgi:hypothetical protein